MKNVSYLHNVWGSQTLGQAVGENALSRPEPRFTADERSKVIDLAAWKAENLEPLDSQFEELESSLELYEGRELVRRPRMHWDARAKGELAATLSVAAVMLVMLLRVLAF